MNTNEEFLPNGELAKFITMQVLRPQVEAFRDRGHPIEATILFVAGKQRREGPTLTAKGRVVRVQIEIHCHWLYTDFTMVLCQCRLLESPPANSGGEAFEWDLKTTVKRGVGGLDATGTLVSAKVTATAKT